MNARCIKQQKKSQFRPLWFGSLAKRNAATELLSESHHPLPLHWGCAMFSKVSKLFSSPTIHAATQLPTCDLSLLALIVSGQAL
jgi:hypothetical protein